jgi:hypothetical protein
LLGAGFGSKRIQLTSCLLDVKSIYYVQRNYRIYGLYISEAIEHDQLTGLHWERVAVSTAYRNSGSSKASARGKRALPRTHHKKLRERPQTIIAGVTLKGSGGFDDANERHNFGRTEPPFGGG